MDVLFTSLTDALSGSFSLALVASFGWGVLSILLSPCHLSSIPLVIGFLTVQREKRVFGGVILAFIFAAGIFLSIAVIGAITAASGRMMGDIGPYGKYIVAGIFFIVGLSLMDVIRLPDIGLRVRPLHARSVFLSAFALGSIFGIALGPCTFAFMAPVIGLAFQLSAENPVKAGLLVLLFGLGHCSIIVAAGGITSRIQAYLDWTNRSSIVRWTKRIAGFLVVLGGMYALFSS